MYEKLQRDAVAPEMLVAGLLFVIQSLMRLMVQHPVVQEKGYVLLCQYRNMSISDGMELHESHIKPFRDAYAGILTVSAAACVRTPAARGVLIVHRRRCCHSGCTVFTCWARRSSWTRSGR